MLSVRRRDVSKGVELGLGFESCAEMDEPELEEGEACFIQEFDDDDDDDDDYDPNVDPDVAFSYIGEKLQDVLGHFQKDFEAGVTAQNLGAKFGDYGSFLPTYQRAPAWSHLRSSAEVDSHNSAAPLSKSYPEGNVNVLRRHEEASSSNVPKRTEANVSSSRFEREKNSGQSSETHIAKMDNLSTHKLAKCYKGPNLDLSSSPLGQNLSDTEEDAPNESPSRIIQIMTSLLVHENLLLSPLTEHLINLTVKQRKLPEEGRSTISQKVAKASPNVSYPSKSDGHNFREKKSKSSKKGISSLQLKNLNADTKIDTDTDTLACEKFAISASMDITNGEKIDINVQSKERNAESADFIDENAKINKEKDTQLPFRKENLSSGRKKKLKGTHKYNERDNSVPRKRTENPKANEDRAKAKNIYKDLFGEMELDKELEIEENGSIEKELNVKNIDRLSMSEEDTKSALNAATISGDLVSLPSEMDKKYGIKETNVHGNQEDEAQFNKYSKKKLQASIDNRTSNGTSHSSRAKEVEPLLLHHPNLPEKHIHSNIVIDRLFEQHPSGGNGGDYPLPENNSKRVLDQNGCRVSKKIKTNTSHCHEGDRERDREKMSHQIKSENNSFLRAKEENGNCNSEIDKSYAILYKSRNKSMDCTESFEEKLNANCGKIETEPVAKKESTDEGAKERTTSHNLTKSGDNNGLGVKFGHTSSRNQKQNLDKKSLQKELEKVDRGEDSEKLRSHSLPPSGRGRSETLNHSHHINNSEHKENRVNNLSMNNSEGDIKDSKPKNPMYNNDHKVKDKDGSSLGKRDSSCPAASNALKEAKDLKHIADRLKSTGASAESTGFYFEAALKFLHGAFLLETGNGESSKQNEAIPSMQIYSSTGQLCGYCGQQYEKSKDMATAALAYKCMEVAYMRVIYSSRARANRDRLELEAASQIGPPGKLLFIYMESDMHTLTWPDHIH